MLQRREAAPGVLELRLDRPPVNALSPDLVDALTGSLARAPESGARAVVLSGRPGMFSAGLDVPVLLGLDRRAMFGFWRSFIGLLGTLAGSPIPIAVAITGHCPAGGTVLALFADYRIAAAGEFKLGLNEVEVGLPMPALIYSAMRRLTGSRLAEQLAVSGRLVEPAEALACGLVDRVVEPGRVVEIAVRWAEGILELPGAAFAATRAVARADLVALFDSVGEAQFEALNEVWFSAETQAAMRRLVARLAERRSGK